MVFLMVVNQVAKTEKAVDNMMMRVGGEM